jgi:hypothetical protein
MKLSSGCPDPFGESCLDIHMNVLVFDREIKVTSRNFIFDFAKSTFDLGEFILGQNSSPDLAPGVGD